MMRKDPYLLIDEFGNAHPNALRLAEVVSIAVNVEPELLRMARLILVPEANAGDEADLWFSPLVQARNMLGFVFYPEVSKILRIRLKSKNWLIDDIWSKVFAPVHKSISPALFIEEEITWRALKDPNDPEIENLLRGTVAAIVNDNNQNGISYWFLRSLPNLNDSIHQLEITPMLELGARLRIGDNKNSFHNIKKSMASKPMADWVSEFVPPNVGTAKIGVSFVETGIEFGNLNSMKEAEILELPATNPLLVEVSWKERSGQKQSELILLEINEKFLFHVDAVEVELKTLSRDWWYKLRRKEQALDLGIYEIIAAGALAILTAFFTEKVSGKLAEKAKEIYQKVKEKLSNDSYADQTLQRVEEQPTSKRWQVALEVVITEKMKEDFAFAQEIQKMVERAKEVTGFKNGTYVGVSNNNGITRGLGERLKIGNLMQSEKSVAVVGNIMNSVIITGDASKAIVDAKIPLLIEITKLRFKDLCQEYGGKKKRILIVGDVMLDHYIKGTTAKYQDTQKNHIILKGGEVYMVNDEPKILGGAANIAMELSEISDVTLISVIGSDYEGNTLKKLCEDNNIHFNLIETPEVKTTTKIYIHRMTEASTEKVIRFDNEDVNSMTNYCNNESVQNDIIDKIKEYVTKIDCIVIIDHQKGMISKKLVDKISGLATNYKIPLYVDPKYAWEKFRSVKIEAILPDMKEAASALYDIKNQEFIILERDLNCKLEKNEYDKLVKNFPNCKNFVIKAASKGAVIMSQSPEVYSKDTNPFLVEERKIINPFFVEKKDFETDVGCGDVFDAYAIVGMLSDYTLEESVLFANFVAGLKTKKSLREHISLDEIKYELEEDSFKKYITDNSSVIQKWQ